MFKRRAPAAKTVTAIDCLRVRPIGQSGSEEEANTDGMLQITGPLFGRALDLHALSLREAGDAAVGPREPWSDEREIPYSAAAGRERDGGSLRICFYRAA